MPSSSESILNAGYIAPNTFMSKRETRRVIFDRYREDTMFDFLIHSNRTKKSAQTEFGWFEHDYLYTKATISGATGGGAGAEVQITVTRPADDGDHQKLAPGKKWDLVMIDGKRGWVQAIDKSNASSGTFVFTVKPVTSTGNFVPSGGLIGDLAGSTIVFFSNAKADGTTQPDSMIRKPNRFYNYTQIFATQFKVNGSASANEVEVEVDGKPYYYLQGIEDAANKHNLDMEYAYLLGEMSEGLTDDENGGEPVYLTRGLEKFVDDFGNLLPYTTTFDYDKMTVLEKTLARERAAKNIMLQNGINLNIDMQRTIKDLVANNGMNYAAFGNGNANARHVDFGFDAFRFSNRTYFMKECEALNYEPVTGFSGSPYPDMGFAIPLDRVKNPKPEGDGDEYQDTISLRFKQNDRTNRFVKHWTRDVTITNTDQLEFNHLSEGGLEMVGLNAYVKIHK